MKNDQKPRPFMEYQTRMGGIKEEGGKYRGMVNCQYTDASLKEPEYFDVVCDELRDTREEALSDSGTLFYFLETTSPPTVAFSGHIFSLPTVEEHTRAKKWLQEHAHVALDFAREFPDARLANPAPLGGSTVPG